MSETPARRANARLPVIIVAVFCALLLLGVAVPVLRLATGDHQFAAGGLGSFRWLPPNHYSVQRPRPGVRTLTATLNAQKPRVWQVDGMPVEFAPGVSQVEIRQWGRLQWFRMRSAKPAGSN